MSKKVTLILRLKTLDIDTMLVAVSARGLLGRYLQAENVNPNRAILVTESGDHILLSQWEYNAPAWALRFKGTPKMEVVYEEDE